MRLPKEASVYGAPAVLSARPIWTGLPWFIWRRLGSFSMVHVAQLGTALVVCVAWMEEGGEGLNGARGRQWR